MSRAIKLWLCLLITALITLAVSHALSPAATVAQQPNPSPSPDPKPSPSPEACSACCDMAVGGRTIAGPGRGGQYVFLSTRPRNICVTVKNDNAATLRLGLYESAILSGGIGGSGGIASREIAPGETASICDNRTAAVIFDCSAFAACTAHRWRVDLAD